MANTDTSASERIELSYNFVATIPDDWKAEYLPPLDERYRRFVHRLTEATARFQLRD